MQDALSFLNFHDLHNNHTDFQGEYLGYEHVHNAGLLEHNKVTIVTII